MALAALLDGHGDVRVFDRIGGHFNHEFLSDVDLFDFDLDEWPVGFLRFGFLCGEGLGLGGLRGLDLHALALRHGGR